MNSNSAPASVLVTGANGFLGYHVAVGALEAGYHVRATVRRQDSIDEISQEPTAQKYLANKALSFVLIPDYTKPGALFEVAKDCSFIIHLASPLPTQPGNLEVQAIACTKAAIEAAENTPSVKRIVFTSSTSALRPHERVDPSHPDNQKIAAGRGDEVPTITAESRNLNLPPVSDDASGFERYVVSKSSAQNYVEAYMAKSDPSFSVVNIMPGFVLGPDKLTRDKKNGLTGSNMIYRWIFEDFDWNAMLGIPPEVTVAMLGEVVSLRDTVEAHINALNTEKVPGKIRNFLLCTEGPDGPVFSDAEDILRRNLPEQVASGAIPFKGRKFDTIKHKFDASTTERDLLGRKHDSYEKMTVDTISWYISLPE
ncbi:MAG: hypothetical protein M1820_004701 [Bogoriella megaspora]|nr:MAG: hypothetical protein M1820_004701 [Bogoriella megaspora]